MKQIIAAVEKHTQRILDAERFIWAHPETGYKEFQTSAYMAQAFRELGYELTMAEGITGFCALLDTGRPGPEILVLGEMDSIICPEHPEADPITGAVHSCGHNAQCAALIGIAAALKEPGILDGLCGKIRLCAVPAEELLEIEFRAGLKKEGKIRYFGGKSEFLARGYFDTVDMALMIHASTTSRVIRGSAGCIAKQITYKGVAAHAGGSPWNGRNALYAATCGLNAVNAIRETFREPDVIRVHPIITSGGVMVNAIPETATLESYVRGSSFDAICSANRRVNRALCGAALSLGTNIDITDYPGYAPLRNDPTMAQIAVEAANQVIPEHGFHISQDYSSGSTDMGDLCCVMPVLHPYISGGAGRSHGNDYQIVDPVHACIDSAKLQLAMLRLLLEEDGRRAKEVLENAQPPFPSKDSYLSYMDTLCDSGDRITYNEDETAASVRL